MYRHYMSNPLRNAQVPLKLFATFGKWLKDWLFVETAESEIASWFLYTILGSHWHPPMKTKVSTSVAWSWWCRTTCNKWVTTSKMGFLRLSTTVSTKCICKNQMQTKFLRLNLVRLREDSCSILHMFFKEKHVSKTLRRNKSSNCSAFCSSVGGQDDLWHASRSGGEKYLSRSISGTHSSQRAHGLWRFYKFTICPNLSTSKQVQSVR